MKQTEIDKLRLKLVEDYYKTFFPDNTQFFQKEKQSILNRNRSPCTALWKFQSDTIIPIDIFKNSHIKVSLVIQEVKNGVLFCVINSRQISKNKFTELFKEASEMRRFRICLKNIKKIFSQKATLFLCKELFKGEKGKIERHYKNKKYFQ